jgi:hypothetical protein
MLLHIQSAPFAMQINETKKHIISLVVLKVKYNILKSLTNYC